MGLIKLADAHAGMVLARDARDRTGRLLLRKGLAITEGAMRVFRMWGVGQIDVEGVGPTPDVPVPVPPVDEATLEEARVQTDDLFRHTNRQHPMVSELMRLSSDRLAARLARATRRDP
jgi:hypothetical protein